MIAHNRPRIVLLVTLIVGGWSIASNGQPNPTDTGDHCKDDATSFMQKNFGDVLTFVHWEKDARNGPPPQAGVVFVVTVEECAGYFVVDSGISDFCGRPHYGNRTSYFRRVFAVGDCTKFLSGQMYRHEGH